MATRDRVNTRISYFVSDYGALETCRMKSGLGVRVGLYFRASSLSRGAGSHCFCDVYSSLWRREGVSV